jgi:hypothetical protein
LQDTRLQKLMMTPTNIKHRLTNWLEVEKLINKEILFYENKE